MRHELDVLVTNVAVSGNIVLSSRTPRGNEPLPTTTLIISSTWVSPCPVHNQVQRKTKVKVELS